MKFILKYTSVFLLLFIFGNSCVAQTQTLSSGEMDMQTYLNVLLVILFILINAIFLPLLRTSEVQPMKEKKKSPLQVLKEKLSGLKPIEQEHTLILEDDYDGIHELNNNIPPWFNILFYGTIVIAIIYFLNFHVFNTGKLPFQEYADEVHAAELQREELIRTGAFINENSVELLNDQESISAGKLTFMINCVTCHGDGGQGTIGPNLTDEYWIHGDGIKNVFKTIKYGIPAKGMITWMNQMNPKKMQQVASYVISLKGTNPPGGKIPEGTIFAEAVNDSVIAINDTAKKSTDSPPKDTLIKDIMKKDSASVRKK